MDVHAPELAQIGRRPEYVERDSEHPREKLLVFVDGV